MTFSFIRAINCWNKLEQSSLFLIILKEDWILSFIILFKNFILCRKFKIVIFYHLIMYQKYIQFNLYIQYIQFELRYFLTPFYFLFTLLAYLYPYFFFFLCIFTTNFLHSLFYLLLILQAHGTCALFS